MRTTTGENIMLIKKGKNGNTMKQEENIAPFSICPEWYIGQYICPAIWLEKVIETESKFIVYGVRKCMICNTKNRLLVIARLHSTA